MSKLEVRVHARALCYAGQESICVVAVEAVDYTACLFLNLFKTSYFLLLGLLLMLFSPSLHLLACFAPRTSLKLMIACNGQPKLQRMPSWVPV